jgi:hypothetical protein
MALLPSFRSPKRDVATDITRLSPILNSVKQAARDAERELAGLRARLQESRDRAGFLFGDDVASQADGNPRDKATLKDLEGFLSRGSIRLRYLERQVAAFAAISAILDETIKPTTPLARKL